MKLRIVLEQPPYSLTKSNTNQTDIVIQNPYTISQEALGAERSIQTEAGVRIDYETYCIEMRELIQRTIKDHAISPGPYDSVILQRFQEPTDFQTLSDTLATLSLNYHSKVRLTLKQCMYGDLLPIEPLMQVIQSLRQQTNQVEINLIEDAKKSLNRHDQAYLSSLTNVTLFLNDDTVVSKPFQDDTLLFKPTPNPALPRDDYFLQKLKSSVEDRLTKPHFFYSQAFKTRHLTASAALLKNFFSQRAQQRIDYTCGPASVKMVAEYYDTLAARRSFSDQPIANKSLWHKLAKTDEMTVAVASKTNEAEGSEIPTMRDYLVAQGISVFDGHDHFVKDALEETWHTYKLTLWDCMAEAVKLGIPIIVNMHDQYGDGHFEVIIGIEKDTVTLADPEGALIGKVAFETLEKDAFIARWQNGSGEYHGRFMIASPNQATTERLTAVFEGVDYHLNGELNVANHPSFKK